MRVIYYLSFLLFCCCFTSCGIQNKAETKPQIVHMQIVDRNGFNETISAKDRLNQYENANFLDPQPYKKVIRVYKKNQEGKTASALTSYHDSGGIFQYLETVNGRAHGTYKEWFPSGKIKLEARVVEGIGDLSLECINTWVFDGQAIIYNDSGAKEAEFFYEKGALTKEGKIFYPSGQLKKITPYEKNLEEGLQIEYSKEGQVIAKTQFSKGNKHGLLEFFGTETRPAFNEEYDNNRLISAFYHDGQGNVISSVWQGQGTKSVFSDQGLSMQIEIANGLEEGRVKEFFPTTCQLKTEYTIKDGQKHGEEILYYSKSCPKMLITWQEGKMQGKVKTWYPHGQLESEREFYNNKKNGPSSAFYSNGQLMLLEEYENDRLIQGYYWKKGDLHEVSSIDQGNGVATLYDSEGIFLKKIFYKKGEPVDE